MPIKDIMVLCDAGEANDYRVETVLLFAKVYQAHVTGVHLVPYPVPVEGGVFPEVIHYTASDQLAKADEIAKILEEKFKAKASELEIPCEWKTIDGVDIRYIIETARYTDIVVVPQGYSRYGEETTQKFDDYLSIHMGRPLIVIPDLKKIFNPPKRIIIAWNESHEAARAVHDALPFLQNAEHIQVVGVSISTDQEKSYMLYCADLRKHLLHHGIDVEVVSLDQSIKGTGGAILESALKYNADLIVMGSYGHSRLKEFLLGGATNHLIKHTTIPLFLSH